MAMLLSAVERQPLYALRGRMGEPAAAAWRACDIVAGRPAAWPRGVEGCTLGRRERRPDERRVVLAPPALRLHRHLSLPVSAADDGARPHHRPPQAAGVPLRQRASRRGGALLGPHLRR